MRTCTITRWLTDSDNELPREVHLEFSVHAGRVDSAQVHVDMVRPYAVDTSLAIVMSGRSHDELVSLALANMDDEDVTRPDVVKAERALDEAYAQAVGK